MDIDRAGTRLRTRRGRKTVYGLVAIERMRLEITPDSASGPCVPVPTGSSIPVIAGRPPSEPRSTLTSGFGGNMSVGTKMTVPKSGDHVAFRVGGVAWSQVADQIGPVDMLLILEICRQDRDPH